MKRGTIVFTCLLLSASSSATHSGMAALPAQTKPSAIKIIPSKLEDALQKKLDAEPKIKSAALAKYGNDLLAKKGIDFQFDLCEFLHQNNPTARGRGARANPRTYKLPMKQTDGSQVVFETRVNDEVWLPQHVTYKVDARVALFKGYNFNGEDTYRDYKKFGASSKIVRMGEVREDK